MTKHLTKYCLFCLLIGLGKPLLVNGDEFSIDHHEVYPPAQSAQEDFSTAVPDTNPDSSVSEKHRDALAEPESLVSKALVEPSREEHIDREPLSYQCAAQDIIDQSAADEGVNNGSSQMIRLLVDVNEPIVVEANELILQADSAIYDGNVNVVRGDVLLHADQASMSVDTKNLQLLGDVSIGLPGAELKGDSASINLQTNASIINGAEYFVDASPSITGAAGAVSLAENQLLTVIDGSYTRCNPQRKEWEIEARNIKIDSEAGQGSARSALLRIFGQPVVYVPYMRFPVGDQRQSGFLFPGLSSRSDGLDIAVPYYFNLAPNYDLFLSPRYLAGHGFITDIKTRWLNHFDRWEFSTLFIDSDSSRGGDSRWSFRLKERSQWRGDVATRLDITRVSDINVARDLQSNNFNLSRSSSLAGRGSIEWLNRIGRIGLGLEKYQSIDPSLEVANEKQPEVWLDLALPSSDWQPSITTRASYTLFDNVDVGDAGSGRQIQRTLGQWELGYPVVLNPLALEFSMGTEFRYYEVDEPSTTILDDQSSAWVNVAYSKVRWVDSWLRSTRQSSRTQLEELLQPELSYTWRQLESGADQLLQIPQLDGFRSSASIGDLFDNSLLGGDLIEPRDQLGFAVRYTRYGLQSAADELESLEADRSSRAVRNKQAELVLGASRYFSRELVSDADRLDKETAWFLQGDWSIARRWQTSASIIWSAEAEQVALASAVFRYRPDNRHLRRSPIVNLGYHRRTDSGRFLQPEPTEQFDFSLAYPIAAWTLYGRLQYDQVNQRHSEALAGVEFNDCCFRLRFVYRDGIIYDAATIRAERDRTFLLQIQLKGLAGIGGSLEDLLERSIRGLSL